LSTLIFLTWNRAVGQIRADFSFSLPILIEYSVTQFGGKSDQNRGDLVEIVYRFLQNRIAHLLAEDEFSKDTVAAVLNASCDNIPQTWSRVRALENLKSKPDFEPIALASN
jgi:glycyl-tRNA synthetase beta chain